MPVPQKCESERVSLFLLRILPGGVTPGQGIGDFGNVLVYENTIFTDVAAYDMSEFMC